MFASNLVFLISCAWVTPSWGAPALPLPAALLQHWSADCTSGECSLVLIQTGAKRSHVKRSWTYLGAGCCSGKNAERPQLRAASGYDLSRCQAECEQNDECESVEFYRKSGYCVLHSGTTCTDSAADQTACGEHHDQDAHSYGLQEANSLNELLSRVAAQQSVDGEDIQLAKVQDTDSLDHSKKWVHRGTGCCAGVRGGRARLHSGGGYDLDSCKRKCERYSDCGAIDFFIFTNWCFVWSNANRCDELDTSPQGCGSQGSLGVQAFRLEQHERAGAPLEASLLEPQAVAAEPQIPAVVEAAFQPARPKSQMMMSTATRTWTHVGSGCCTGSRSGPAKLFAGTVADLSACQAKCEHHQRCGAVDFFSANGWCFVWSSMNLCRTLDTTSESCSASRDVQAYRLEGAPLATGAAVRNLVERKTNKVMSSVTSGLWSDLGVGCCSGNRKGAAKLWAGEVKHLTACKSKCSEFHGCGAVDFFGASKWCFVWSKENSCQTLETNQDACGAQGGSVRAYRLER
mmetsp:Transcript_65325/g.142329  ORF Transcript_65325/g.142329 Transcript_65325/m.142329 type:complete len:516 (-) Transcript_65325:172-1719(-)